MTITPPRPRHQSGDADPFSHDILEDPLPFQADLRDAGPVVYLDQYDVFAMGRYNEVHAALTDWQAFQSAAGVGLSNFRNESAVAAAEPAARGGPTPPRRAPRGPHQDPRAPGDPQAGRLLGRGRRGTGR